MDLLVLLTLSLFFISPLLIFFFYKHKTINRNLPLGKTGWPIIGESFEFVSNGQSGHPDIFFKKRMNKYSSEIFKSSIAGEKLAVLCGPSGNKFLFSNENKLVVTWVPRSIRKIISGNSTTVNNIYKIIPEFIKPEALKQYIPIIDSRTRNQLQREWVGREIQVSPLSRNLTFSLVCKLFMSIEDLSLVANFTNDFKKVMSGIHSIPVNLPGTTFNRAINAAKLLRARLLLVIKERRRVLTEKSSYEFDLLSKFLSWIDEDGKFLSESDIAISILGTFLASHDSTSTLITFVVYYLADHPQVYDKVLQEQLEISESKQADELLNWDDIQRMKYSRNFINEVLRLQPTTPGFFRRVIHDFTYANFSVPKGWKAFWSVHTTHKDPKYFPDPEKFDPTRFQGKGPTPFSFTPFGGGPRMCPGAEFARTVVLIFIHNFVVNFKFKKLIQNEKIVYTPSPTPVHGLPVAVWPRQT